MMENGFDLLKKIDGVSFAMDELRLYLDTHPDCEEARAYFSELMEKRAELCDNYTAEYGPLDAYFLNVDNGWYWNDGYMPWEKEANG